MKKKLLKVSAFLLALSLINGVSPDSALISRDIETIYAVSESDNLQKYETEYYELQYSVSGKEAVIKKLLYNEEYLEKNVGDGYDMPVLPELVIPEKIDGYTVTGIDDFAMRRARYDKLILPDTLRSIGSSSLGTFSYRRIPDVFSLPESLETIGSNIFEYNYPEKIVIPASVNSIECQPFNGTEVREIIISEGNTHFCMDNGALMTSDGTRLIMFLDSYSGKVGEYQVPEGVKQIDSCAFMKCRLSCVLLPESLEDIGESAFSESDIEKITIPSKVKTIKNRTFFRCRSLTDVNLNSVETVEEWAFSSCFTIVSIDFGSRLKKIGENGFSAAFDLKNKNSEILIPETVTDIGTGAFGIFIGSAFKVDENNKNYASRDGIIYNKDFSRIIQCPENNKITDFVVPETVKSIGKYAFSGVSSLEKIELPDSLDEIEDYAFMDCDNLKSVTIPKSITRINDYAFWSCDRLSEIILQEGLESIGIRAFDNTAVTELNLPKSLKEIGEEAFYNCTELEKVTLYPELRNVHYCAFFMDADISFVRDAEQTAVADGVLFSKDMTVLLSFPVTRMNYNGLEYTVPDSVKEIAAGAFEGSAVTRVNIPDSVEKIGDGAFRNCISLLNISFGSTSVNMGKDVFNGCSRLYCTKLPYGTEKINSGTFAGCTGIHSARIPDGVKEIGPGSMPSELTEVYIPSSVTKIDSSAFELNALNRICGEKKSYAQTFAEKNGIEFIPDEPAVNTKTNADINGDGKINIVDLISVKAFLAGDSTVKVTSADVNGDGSSDAADVLCLCQTLFGKKYSSGLKDAEIIIDDSFSQNIYGNTTQLVNTPSELYDFFKTCYPEDDEYCRSLTDKYSIHLAGNTLYCSILHSQNFNPKIELYSSGDAKITYTERYPEYSTLVDDHCQLNKLVIVSVPKNAYKQDITADYYLEGIENGNFPDEKTE